MCLKKVMVIEILVNATPMHVGPHRWRIHVKRNVQNCPYSHAAFQLFLLLRLPQVWGGVAIAMGNQSWREISNRFVLQTLKFCMRTHTHSYTHTHTTLSRHLALHHPSLSLLLMLFAVLKPLMVFSKSKNH